MKNPCLTRPLHGLALLALACAAPPAAAQCETDLVTAGDAVLTDSFGGGLDLDGQRLIAGKPRFVSAAYDDDSAYVFDRGLGGWNQTAKLTPQMTASAQDFGAAVAVRGDTAVIGDPGGTGQAFFSGRAHVFELGPGGWTEMATLAASDGGFSERFGASVALDASQTRAVVGAFFDDGRGAAYVFEGSGSSWTQVAKLQADLGASGVNFANSVAIDGDRILIGDWVATDKGFDAGAAYVFDRQPNGQWMQTAKLLASDGAPGDNFGIDVSVEGGRALVGACGDDLQRGSAYVFELVGSSWIEMDKVVASDGAPGDLYGISARLSGDRAILGARSKSNNTGAAYLVERLPGGSWIETAPLTTAGVAAGWTFGEKVALSGDVAAVGAPGDGVTGAPHAGSVHVYKASPGGSLFGTGSVVSLATGGVQSFELATCPPRPLLPYLLLGSASGTSPGVMTDGLVLPLALDSYLLYTLEQPNVPPYANSFGVLDAAGEATAAFTVPPGLPPSAAGLTLNHAFAVIELLPTLLAVVQVSNPVPIDLVP